jgi:hypothetical protein
MPELEHSVSFDLTEIFPLLTQLIEIFTVRYSANLNLTV